MHAVQFARSRREAVARRAAERFFSRLRHNGNPDTICVTYPHRFPSGECVIAVVIPSRHVRLGVLARVARAHARYHFPPTVINTRNGPSLCLISRFRKIQQHEQQRLLDYAKMLADWAEEVFKMKAIVEPQKGLVGLLWRLHAL